MIAYKVEKYLRRSWIDVEITVLECIAVFSTLVSSVVEIGNSKLVKVPKPNELCNEILKKIDVKLLDILPYKEINVVTRKKIKK